MHSQVREMDFLMSEISLITRRIVEDVLHQLCRQLGPGCPSASRVGQDRGVHDGCRVYGHGKSLPLSVGLSEGSRGVHDHQQGWRVLDSGYESSLADVGSDSRV